MTKPVAYLRKSRVTNDRHLSWEVQETRVRELAERHGENGNLVLLSDWNRSGGKGRAGRPGYDQMVSMIEAGEVSALYSYSLSRLSRSIGDFTDLVQLCLDRNVPIRLVADNNLDFTTATGRFHVNMLAALAQMERELASERSKDTVAVRRARGDRIGQSEYGDKPGESVEAILEAYRDAGSVIGAGRLLNERKVPTRSGRPWSTTTVRDILQRHRALPYRKRPGAKAAAPFILFHLVRCHCGRTMSASRFTTTGGTKTKQYTQVVYRCLAGRTTPDHGRLNVSESKLLPWVKDEAARLRMPGDAVAASVETSRRREVLEAQREHLGWAVADGLLTRDAAKARATEIDEELASLDERGTFIEIPAIDWSRDAKAINAVLRRLWRHVELDGNMQPVRAEWIVPEWRS